MASFQLKEGSQVCQDGPDIQPLSTSNLGPEHQESAEMAYPCSQVHEAPRTPHGDWRLRCLDDASEG